MIQVRFKPGIRVETDEGVLYVTRYQFKYRASFQDKQGRTLVYSKAYAKAASLNNFANKYGIDFTF